MFKKILIANRGEIARRVMRSCDRLGIATVAVYSDADRDAAHVAMANEAVRLGPAPSSESYLLIDAVVDACTGSGADAVHPGYGFLSENAAFAEALAAAGIAFIGPGIRAIDVMGDKIRSKTLAAEAGVNVIPGYTDVVRDADHAVEIASEIGYPVMLKASAGGGGKGMRVAVNEADCREGFERASSEATSSFGDDRIFIEKFITTPRHIEIQVLADAHGNAIHLGERECSIQRRHQKVIEEAPSPFVTESMREDMGTQALELARAVDYKSAGTVEFIVDQDRSFYFLEMNTRLQVEHPVTEMVTGVDLVEQMIRIAAGEKLAIAQSDVTLTGWAMESRIYAEDPARGFLPSTGRLKRYREPVAQGVRVDSGVVEGAEISVYYDPMISKLVSFGSTRAAAIDTMCEALDDYVIDGVTTNMAFLQMVLRLERFREGQLSTNFIADEFPDGVVDIAPDEITTRTFCALAMVASAIEQRRGRRISGQLHGGDGATDRDVRLVCVFDHDEHHYSARVELREGNWIVLFDDGEVEVNTDWWPGDPQCRARIDGDTVIRGSVNLGISREITGYQLEYRGTTARCVVLPPTVAALARHMIEKPPMDMSRYLVSPMPGLLISVSAHKGQSVKAGQELAVVEAMKMENVLVADSDGVIDEIMVQPGNSLSVDQPILSFVTEDAPTK